MSTIKAVVLEEPQHLTLRQLELDPPGEGDIVVDIEWSGISTGTERLLWSGRMPAFPGMGYPLVPGYESVGRVVAADAHSSIKPGDRVFVPGAKCYGSVRGLFGGASEKVVLPAARALPIAEPLGEKGVLLALAATAYHAISAAKPTGMPPLPDLIVGHGVLGRVIARLVVLQGGSPTVWETEPSRQDEGEGYRVIDPSEDSKRDYRRVCDVSGDARILDTLIPRVAPGGEIVLAGFYAEPLSFQFAPAFMRESCIRVAAQWQPADLLAVQTLIESGALSLDGLITHRAVADDADAAYRTAFSDPRCLKMVLDWRKTT